MAVLEIPDDSADALSPAEEETGLFLPCICTPFNVIPGG